MNKDRKTKNYQINNETYEFNSDKFTVLCNDRSKLMKLKKTSTDFLLQLEEDLNYEATASTIKGWMYGNNSPATIDMVDKVANVFGLERMDLLVLKEKDNVMMNKLEYKIDEKTRDLVSDIYGKFVDAIAEYKYSDGFTDPAYGIDEYSTHEDWMNTWFFNSSKLEDLIKKSRPYIERGTIQSLLALCGELFEFLEYDNLDKSLYGVAEDGEDETGYQMFLNGREDTGHMENMYLSFKIDQFNERLEKILANYLP